MTPLEIVEGAYVAKMGAPLRNGYGRCPAHDDNSPSLSVRVGTTGAVVVKCHAGCSAADVVDALGLKMADLFPPKDDEEKTPPANVRHHRPDIHYPYHNAEGVHVYSVVRRFPKGFYQVPASGKRGAGAMDGIDPVLYRLPDVIAAVASGVVVWLVEGEKDAHAMVDYLGVCATTISGGVGGWPKSRRHVLDTLRGAQVVVVADNDAPGLEHAEIVRRDLEPVAASVLVVRAAEGKDAYDHLRAGRGIDEFVVVDATETPPASLASADDDTDQSVIEFIDWAQEWKGETDEEAIVAGLMFRGRWTAVSSPAKVGKSTFGFHVAHSLARGLDPFGETPPGEPLRVIYLDPEMGRRDIILRAQDLDVTPTDLVRLHYTDMVDHLNVVENAERLLRTVDALGADVVVLDGLNGGIKGEENDSGPWRDLFEFAFAPLKQRGVAVLTFDNVGKDVTKGARGSSVKTDKADIVLTLTRTDGGIKLKATHSRTSAALKELDLKIRGADGSEPIRYMVDGLSWVAGTKDVADLLGALGVPVTAGRPTARKALLAAGHKHRNDVIASAIRWRRSNMNPVNIAAQAVPELSGTALEAVPEIGDSSIIELGDSFGDSGDSGDVSLF